MTERDRLHQQHQHEQNWLQWGPYLSERQWGTVREDYSTDGSAWTYFSHDQARSRAYRWGEDGLAGISDDTQTLCFALALWNGQDAILKERLFGLDNHQGNHGEDVKELYYYLDNTPTHSYQKQLYKYPQAAFPYQQLVAANEGRPLTETEFELLDTGIFDDNRYFDVVVEYAKAGPTDLLIRLTVRNHGPDAAPLHLLPTLWFRNNWAFGDESKPQITRQLPAADYHALRARHARLGEYTLYFPPTAEVLVTENETNTERIFNSPNAGGALVKDAFHAALIPGDAPHPSHTAATGTKAAPVYRLTIGPGATTEVRLRLSQNPELAAPLGDEFAATFADRQREADEFYRPLLEHTPLALASVKRQAWAGVLWSKQYYQYDVARWLDGDPGQPPLQRPAHGRNTHWRHLKAQDIILMPDKWEYPWFAAWDLVFHCLALAPVDSALAKQQCLLLTSSSRYYAADGQLPSYEYDFSNGNPAVRGQSAWLLFDYERQTSGFADWDFLRAAFSQLQANHDWWMERFRRHPEAEFRGSFLGLDNASVLNREEVPGGGYLRQVDSVAWLAGYTVYRMRMAVELAGQEPSYEAAAIELLNQYVEVGGALADIAATWQDDPALLDTGFHYDVLVEPGGRQRPVPMRSIMGLTPLFGQLVLEPYSLAHLPAFVQAVQAHRTAQFAPPRYPTITQSADGQRWLFALLPRPKLEQVLPLLFDEDEMLAPSGIRSLSKAHQQHPATMEVAGEAFTAAYTPGEADSTVMGGNSNWRGPVWLPLNFVLLRALYQLVHFYGADAPRVEVPRRSGQWLSLKEAADHLAQRMQSPFLPDENGRRPIHGADERYATDPNFRDLLLFHEYFDGDTARGCGASHQTGWTALVTLLDKLQG